MYASYWRDRETLPPNRLVEIRFEDLVADPVAKIKMIYQQLELDGVEDNLQNITDYFARRGDHQKNANKLNPKLKNWIDSNWLDYKQRFEYE